MILKKEKYMKEIVLKQYIEVRRVVKMRVPDDWDEKNAAESLDDMPLDNAKLSDNVQVLDPWCYISDTGIENENGETVLHNEEEDVNRG